MIALALFTVLAAPITLDEVKAASRQNLEALKAEIELRRAGAGVKLARSAIWPQASLRAQGGAQWQGPNTSFQTVPEYDMSGAVVGYDPRVVSIRVPSTRASLSLDATVSQLLYDGGRWWNAIAQAGATERAAQGQLDEQRLASELEAVSRFYELLKAQTSVDVLTNSVRRSETQLERARSLFEAGRAPKLDAIDSEVNLGNDRIAVLRQHTQVVAAQVQLLKWLGQPSREVEAVDPLADRPAVRAPAYDAALAAAKAHRPLLQALEAQVQAAERGVDIAWSPFLPTVSLSGTYRRESPSVGPFFDPTLQNQLSGGLVINWNFFSGFGTEAQVEQARAGVSTARVQLEQAGHDVEGDLRRSLDALTTQLQIAQIAADNLKVAKGAVELAEQRFQAGAGSTIEVRDAQVKLTSASLNALQARVDVEIARAALKRVIGTDVEAAP